MYPELNPFVPGSGLMPPTLVGRSSEIDAFDLVVARSRTQSTSRGMILSGLRGVGKTVLLNRLRAHAENADWFVVSIEGRATETGSQAIRQKLGRELLKAASKASRTKGVSDGVISALRTVKSFGVSVGVASVEIGIEPASGRGDSGQIEIDFEELVEDLAPALRRSSRAFGLFIDEMQELDDELLVALLAAQHKAGQNGWPFYIVGAGLPVLPAKLGAARSYAERMFDYRRVGPLTVEAASAALRTPIETHGATIDQEALDHLVSASEGYPYFLQTFGRAAWDAGQNKLITLDDAEAAVTVGYDELDVGFYPSRWDRVTASERRYLRAMASLGDVPVSTADIAGVLDSTLASQSTSRQGLIDKGIVYSPERGKLAFTVPGMPSFIERQHLE